MATVLGIDEAGRGAVIGPLVVAGVLAQEKERELLLLLGAKDSKEVPRPRRKEILFRIVRAFPTRVIAIPATEVDRASLSFLLLKAFATLVGKLNPDRVVIDAPVPPRAIPRFLSVLSKLTGLEVEKILAFPKADQIDPVVSASSLAAKVTRDAYIAHLRKNYGDFGWGYPGEEALAFLESWLSAHGNLPPICRTRWRPVQELLQRKLDFHSDE